jgi:hypothetical protein
MRITIGNKQLVFEINEIKEVDAKSTKMNTPPSFHATTFLNASSMNELIGMLEASGLVNNYNHGKNWFFNARYGGNGNLETAKWRASGYYRSKYGLS